ncbi:hypothetical protein OpiT1DRAFT_04739 [Opitutaceae bacterium TAV1]|nr:hypothetical protein OpiT1DRAFT_04739 [Opitutaceae bacterium TAV1]
MKTAQIHIHPHVCHAHFDGGDVVTLQGSPKHMDDAAAALAHGLKFIHRGVKVTLQRYDTAGQKIEVSTK